MGQTRQWCRGFVSLDSWPEGAADWVLVKDMGGFCKLVVPELGTGVRVLSSATVPRVDNVRGWPTLQREVPIEF